MAATEPQTKEPDFLDTLIAENWDSLLGEAEAVRQLERAAREARGGWPGYGRTVHPVTGFVAEGVPLYVSKRTGAVWAPRNEEEHSAVLSDTPRYLALLGGEGSGKSTGAVVKTLERLRRGMEWIFGSPDFEHFKTSAWPLLREWCPSEVVDKSDRHMMEESWEAARKFELHVRSQTGKVVALRCMGIDDPHSVRGGNVSGATFDEASRHKDATAFKFLAGRVRLLGPAGEPPQLVVSTTPEMHWLHDYFGPLKEDEPDPFAEFKASARVVKLRTADNIAHLDPDYVRERRATLTEAEARVYMDAEWENLDDGAPFLESMIWWDACKEDLPPLGRDESLVCAMDAGISNDPFAFVGVARHPFRPDVLCPRLMLLWKPTKGRQLDFDLIQGDIEALKGRYNILSIHYDPYQCHQMGTRLRKTKVFHTVEFKQGGEINIADKALLDRITEQRVAWCARDDNSGLLYEHVRNADRKLEDNRKIRMVKRTDSKKIDLARALSMACHRAGRLWRVKRPAPRSSVACTY